MTWQGHELVTKIATRYAPGTSVCWGILPAHCIVHRRDRPSRGERENPVSGVIADYLALGETAEITMRASGAGGADAADFLHFSTPLHVAERNHLGAGESITVSLLADGIHLMPDDALERGGGRG